MTEARRCDPDIRFYFPKDIGTVIEVPGNGRFYVWGTAVDVNADDTVELKMSQAGQPDVFGTQIQGVGTLNQGYWSHYVVVSSPNPNTYQMTATVKRGGTKIVEASTDVKLVDFYRKT